MGIAAYVILHVYKSRCLCHSPKEHWMCMSFGSVGTHFWTGQQLKALVPL